MSRSGFGMLAPPGKQWVPHIGLQQRKRHLERAWKRWDALCAKSERAMAVREALLDEVCEEDQAELHAASLVLAGRIAAENGRRHTRVTPVDDLWITAVESLLEVHKTAKRGKMVSEEGA